MLASLRKLWAFHGGVHPDFQKAQSTQQPVRLLPLPEKLIIPIQQHMGYPGVILVKTGDYVYKGQMLAKALEGISASVHASSSGTIESIEERPIAHPSGLSGVCIVLIPDGKEDWGKHRLTAYKDYTSVESALLLAQIKEAGIVGLGGATFPTAVKLAGSQQQAINTLIINGAECEPYITSDDMLMREHAAEIVEGIRVVQHMLKLKRCLIGVEDNKPEALKAMKAAVDAVADPSIEIISVPTLYPSGGEKQLIYILTGKEVPSGGIPADIGMLCQNVGTLYAIQQAIVEGQPLLSRYVTLTGQGIKQPQNCEVLLGTPMREVIVAAGGYTDKTKELIMGGPMMGFTVSDDNAPVVKASNCLLVASEHDITQKQAAMPCIRCGQCMQACPAQLLPQQLYWYTRAKDFERVEEHHIFDCIECGCCDYVCPSHIPLVSYFRFAKGEIIAQGDATQKADLSRSRHEFRDFRLARAKEERAALLAKKKAALQKKNAKGSSTDAKKAAIQAATARAKAKKEVQAKKEQP